MHRKTTEKDALGQRRRAVRNACHPPAHPHCDEQRETSLRVRQKTEGVQKTEGKHADSEYKEAVKEKVEEVVEGRNALIVGGEAAFFWAA